MKDGVAKEKTQCPKCERFYFTADRKVWLRTIINMSGNKIALTCSLNQRASLVLHLGLRDYSID